MNWCMVLIAASVACPWSRNTVRTYYWCEPMPVYVTCQPSPCYTYPSTMVCGPEVASVVAEVKAVEDPAEESTLAEAAGEETDEDATEFVNFSAPAPYNGGDLALDWGVATIGAGTLYPNPQYLATGAQGFFGGAGGGDGEAFYPGVPYTVINNTIINNFFNNGGGNPRPDPIPEPATVAIWLVGGSAALFWLRRRRQHGLSAPTR